MFMQTLTREVPISRLYDAELSQTRETVDVLGLPVTRITMDEVIDEIDSMIVKGKPEYLITANLNFAMLVNEISRLGEAVDQAAMVLADGMPLVWASKLTDTPLPERVTGSDLVPAICERASQKGHRIFLVGGAPGAAEKAAEKMVAQYPGLEIVGIEVPPFRPLTKQENDELVARIRAANADILLVAFGQPKGDIWILENYRELGVPVSIQVGATINFMAGEVSRAPRWVAKSGLEWLHRLILEPRRLGGRYARNALFLAGVVLEACGSVFQLRDPQPVHEI